MPFTLFPLPAGQAAAARADESLMLHAARHGPAACLWQSGQGLVVPRTYQRLPRFPEACRRFERLGWPVTMRQSGGGLVPQGPGIINVSLAYAVEGRPLSQSDAAYGCLCTLISGTLEGLGIPSRAQAVAGSFCDGRYNLAWRDPMGAARKIAGTAQLWRRVDPRPDAAAAHGTANRADTVQVVLVHALVLATADTDALTRLANDFEHAAGNDKRYEPGKIASLHTILGLPADGYGDFTDDLFHRLAHRITAASPPTRAPEH
jgi:hypothetical protein